MRTTNNKCLSKRALALLLSICVILTLFQGCVSHPNETSAPIGSPLSPNATQAIVDAVMQEIVKEDEAYKSATPAATPTNNSSEDLESIVGKAVDNGCYGFETSDTDKSKNDTSQLLSTDWERYVGDLETFVYGLIINQFEYKYNVFPAEIELLEGDQILGLAYTDYSECFASEDETQYCFEAGFLPFCGELDLTQEDFDFGLPIYDLDYTDPNAGFVLAYGSAPFTEHCVVYGKYLKYGVNESGHIFYAAEDYVRGNCDTSLGSLYSYDESRFVYDNDVGNYVNISGKPLYSQIDYDELKKEIDRILESQDANMASVDVKTCAYFSQEAVTSYLLSLQEETFLGYNVSELIAATKSLDPLECYRLTEEGLITLDLKHDGGASSLTRWLVGTSCVIVTAVALVGSIVFIECPPLSSLASAMAGTAIEVFMQVVISGETLENVNWNKVAIAAATGAVSGFLGPYIYASTAGLGYFLADSTIDGLLGGIERAVFAWMDGKDSTEIIKSFGYGFALGFGLSAGFKAAGAVVGKLASKLAPGVRKIAERVFPRLTSKISLFSGTVGGAIYGLKRVADSSIFHSKYVGKKLAERQLQRLISSNSDELIDKSFKSLSTETISDANGNVLSKDMLKKSFSTADDGSVLGYIHLDGEKVQVVKKNGTIGVFFDQTKYQTIAIPGGLSNKREINMIEATTILKEQWLNDSSMMPESISLGIKNKGVDLEDMMPDDLLSVIKKSDWVIHENIDLSTITLAPRKLHEAIKHMGGIGAGNTLGLDGAQLNTFIKSHMGFEFFDRYVSAAATGLVIGTN